MNRPSLSVEEKVAQLFMVGSDTPELAAEIEPFYRYGVGGLILFRHHLQPFPTARELREFLQQQRQQFRGGELTFIAIDQEGGQVERLPHWLFPTGILPVVYGLKKDVYFCEQVNREVAQRLRWLGFNLNFSPTVDLNTEMMNPIIGVRAYGSTPQQVLPFATSIVKTHLDAGVLPVAKHFPGHGSGIVDSHLSLPMFEAWEEAELEPYEALLRDRLPAILVAHGLYPKLAKLLQADGHLPASLSPAIMTQLLRSKMGFNGLVFTDDLIMGAVLDDMDPMEVAVRALEAGADQLVYRRAIPEAWDAFEMIVGRVHQGKFSESLLDEKVSRILAARTRLAATSVYDYPDVSLSEEACHALSLQWAQTGLVELHHQFISPLPLSHRTRWGLVAPDRKTMRHYQPDAVRGKGLMEWCQHYGITPQAHYLYPVEGSQDAAPDFPLDQPLDVIVFVAFNSHLYPKQQALYQQIKQQRPNAKVILASCGMPTDREFLAKPWIHLQLPSFRPAAIQAFVQWLITTPKGSDVT
jgi:beta-N-acetylhexosaminidase